MAENFTKKNSTNRLKLSPIENRKIIDAVYHGGMSESLESDHETESPATGRSSATKKPIGPLVGVVIILLLLVIGALYALNDRITKKDSLAHEQTLQNSTTLPTIIEQRAHNS